MRTFIPISHCLVASRCRQGVGQVRSFFYLVALLAAALAGCQREGRELRLDPPVTAALDKIALMPNRISGVPPQIYFALGKPYEANAYNLSEGKRLYSWFGCEELPRRWSGRQRPQLSGRLVVLWSGVGLDLRLDPGRTSPWHAGVSRQDDDRADVAARRVRADSLDRMRAKQQPRAAAMKSTRGQPKTERRQNCFLTRDRRQSTGPGTDTVMRPFGKACLSVVLALSWRPAAAIGNPHSRPPAPQP